MLVFNFSRIIYIKEIKYPFTALVKFGFSSKFAAKVTGNQFVKLETEYLEKLCDFFKCTPNDLLEWKPELGTTDVKNHHLSSLNRSVHQVTISEKLSKLSLKKVNEINKLIDDSIA